MAKDSSSTCQCTNVDILSYLQKVASILELGYIFHLLMNFLSFSMPSSKFHFHPFLWHHCRSACISFYILCVCVLSLCFSHCLSFRSVCYLWMRWRAVFFDYIDRHFKRFEKAILFAASTTAQRAVCQQCDIYILKDVNALNSQRHKK